MFNKFVFPWVLVLSTGLISTTTRAQVVVIESVQESLDTALNSKYFEEQPVMAPDGSGIYFTRSGHPDNHDGRGDKGDIWYAQWIEGTGWSVSSNLGSPLNNSEKNSVIGFVNGGQAMFLTNQYTDSKADKGISFSRWENDKWRQPKNIDIPYFKRQSEFKSAALSPDGTVMIFSVMSFGSYGVEDLYFTTRRNDGSWSDLRNLGPVINTRYQEMTPFIAPDNRTIYFASNGHGGAGGLDIFYSVRQDDTWRNWSAPVNLGPKVNSIGAETSFSFLPESDWAVLVSTQNSDGYGDLKRVDISFPEDFVAAVDSIPEATLILPPEPDSAITQAPDVIEPEMKTMNFSGKVLNAKTGATIDGVLYLVSEYDSLTVSSGSDGFRYSLLDADYQLVVKSESYLEYDTAFSITAGAIVEKDFALEPLEVGNTIRLKHVLFEQGTTELVAGSEQDLEAVYHMLRDNPTVEILVAGHTDNQGNFKLNVKLSQDRVNRVLQYFVDKGINKKRLEGKGWGPMKPIASNASEESRRLNRRVEFTITRK